LKITSGDSKIFFKENIDLILKEIIKKEFKKIDNKKLEYQIKKSKRNFVVSLRLPDKENKVIIKIFKFPEHNTNYNTELKIYRKLKRYDFKLNDHLKVPKLITSVKDYLILSYIEGKNLMEYLNQAIYDINEDNEFWSNLFSKLIRWQILFNEKTGYIASDNHIRNYILKNLEDLGLYGIDFEEVKLSNNNIKNLLESFANLYFSIIASNPGIYQSKSIEYKSKLGIKFVKSLISIFDENNLTDKSKIIDDFLDILQKEGYFLMRRRENLGRDGFVSKEKVLNNFNTIINLVKEGLMKEVF
jgi:hypothetical protein